MFGSLASGFEAIDFHLKSCDFGFEAKVLLVNEIILRADRGT
jgi:hypothetical protein